MPLIHVLRTESVTPIEQYLERARASSGDHDAWMDLACVLLYREREFRTATGAPWTSNRLPQAGASLGFAPYDLTPDAQANIATFVHALPRDGLPPDAPDDLFGLKAEVLTGLRATLRPRKAHSLAHLVAGVLARDLCLYDDAVTLASRAVNMQTDVVVALALTRDAACRSSSGAGGPEHAALAMKAAEDAKRHIPRERWRHNWQWRSLERLEERVRQRALAVRRKTEGAAFTRFLTTEADFCAAEHAAAIEGFDEKNVPPELHPLNSLAQRFGVGDDGCRALVIRRTPRAERRTVAAAVEALASRVSIWLESLNGPPYGREAACFFWLLEATEEMHHDGRPQRRSCE